jgi:hypothetical protein
MQELMSHLPHQEQEPMMTEHKFKYIVFNVHPHPLCDQYTLKYDNSMHAITLTTLGNCLAQIQCMMDQKPSVSEQPNKKHKSNTGSSTSGNHNHMRNNNNSDKGSDNKGAACRIPGHSSHLWKECCANKHSPNYDKAFVPKAWLQDGKGSNNKGSMAKDNNKMSNSLQSYLCNTNTTTSTLSGQTNTSRSPTHSNNTHWMEQWKEQE